MCLAAIGDAVRFLLARQSPDGAWRDFALPVGAACCWTTAYTLPRVAAAAALVGCDIRPALRAAAEHLRRHATPHGWGYNTACPADADSTAHALLALPDAHPRHAAALARFFLREGGVRTYRWPPPGHGWGAAHPEVTATAVRALRGWLPSDHALLRAGLAWLATGRAAYWWDAPHYLPLELLRLGLPVADWPPTAPSAFDEALALECTILRGDPARVDRCSRCVWRTGAGPAPRSCACQARRAASCSGSPTSGASSRPRRRSPPWCARPVQAMARRPLVDQA